MGLFAEATQDVRLWTALVLLSVLFVVVRSLLHRSNDQTSAINLDDIILEWDARAMRDRVSIIRCLAIGAFAFTIWMMATLTLQGKMTEGYFTAFNLTWVGPLVAQIIWGKRGTPPPAGPTTTIDAGTVNVRNP